MKNKFLTILALSLSFVGVSQTKKEVAKITKNYDIPLLKRKVEEYKELEKKEKAKAYDFALRNNLPLSYTDKNGNFHELMKLAPDNTPLYYSTSNRGAALSTRATHLNTGGTLGLTLNGQGMVARVWDGGKVRTQHNHFAGRLVAVDDPTGVSYSDHATHVSGTILASGLSTIRGMAYQATGRTFNWTDDESEATAETLGGMLISNHSYGVPITSTVNSVDTHLPGWYIGTYDNSCREWDEIAKNAPYYLMVAAAGNDGQNNNNADPIAVGFDKLTGNKNAKNNLVVANGQDAVVDANGVLTTPLLINSSSSQGPTDDRRIKPDITGNGTDVTSATSGSNSETSTYSGTSMASPNVAGTLLLLQQHHNNITSNFMKAATLKGLACHTADDCGRPGPDANFGWGLLNAKVAAQTISTNGLTSHISEENLAQNQVYTMNVNSLGTSPLMASITWTDVPGEANNGQRAANDLTRALVNDLDIRITRNGTTYYPWKLQNIPSANAIRTEDNNVDNVELIKIDNPAAGNYTITITHKGNLVGGNQDYSLIVTGVSSSFALIPASDDQEVCANQDAVYTFNYTQNGVMTTNFSATNVPAGAIVNFSPASRNSTGLVTMTVSNLSAVTPNSYTIGVVANNGTSAETETKFSKLKIFSNTFTPLTLNTPFNNQQTVATTVNLKWTASTNSESYRIQVSTSPTFTTTVVDATVTQNSYIISNLNQETTYYWKVTAINRCATENVSNATVNNFKTGVLVCGNEFTATDFSNNIIATTNTAEAIVPIVVTGGFTIGDLNVQLDISHTYLSEATVKLEGPASIGSPMITLFNKNCTEFDNINCLVDDNGDALVCATNPAISGNVKPQQTLTNLNGLPADGTWKLIVTDSEAGDGGAINAVKLIFCKLQTTLSVEDNNLLSGLNIYPNPTTGIVNIDLGNANLDNKSIVKLYDVQGRLMATKEMNSSVDSINIANLSEGVYLMSIENGTSKTTKKLVLNR